MTGTAPQATTTSRPPQAETHSFVVTHVDRDICTVDIRGHHFQVDQPLEAGGSDLAPTPTELFAASLATCVAFYAGRFLHRHSLDHAGLRVRTQFTMATDRPARVASVHVTIIPPPGLTEQRRAALLAVASRCTVHNTLHQPPEIDIKLAS